MKRSATIPVLALILARLWTASAGTAQEIPGKPAFPGYFQNGQLRIVSSSHQDTAWMDTPDACRRFRIEHNIMPALRMMRKDPHYTFCMEAALHLMEFLKAHPELREEVIARMKEGRLEFGGTYNEPYESWFSGEELARETYFGRRWIKTHLSGCDSKVAFNPDPPGRAWQMQQILAKAGVPYMFISRYHEGLYRWTSPDGTSVLAYTPGHYGNHLPFLNGAPANCLKAIRAKIQQQGPYYAKRQIPPAYCLINSMDFSQPVDFSPLIHAWNDQPAPADAKLPTMQYSSIRGFFESIDRPAAKFDRLVGERPDVWVYITGPTHHWTSSLKREAAQLLPAAETFKTIASLLRGSFVDWPKEAFDQAWMDEIYIDHGIGGNNGHITDEVFRRKVEHARDEGRRILNDALQQIAARVQIEPALGVPVAVFNDLSWQRSDIVEVALPAGVAGPVHVVDAAGQAVPCQMTTLDSPREINVAAAQQGATATASSAFNKDYKAAKAIDGRWAVRDPDPALGTSHKWNTARGVAGPHWLTIDFGQPRTIHKVVVRHEGVVGAFGGETVHNTCDFQIQGSDTAGGPWRDLVPPVTGNSTSLTARAFPPATIRFLRLYITKGTQPGGDQMGRIYEVQAYADAPPAAAKLLFLAGDVPALGYKTYYIAAGAPPPAKEIAASPEGCGNDFYHIMLTRGGIKSIRDKRTDRELLKTDKFLGGEVFTMLSVAPNNRHAGTDAGEFGAVPLPVMDESFDRVSDHKPAWRVVEDGALRTVFAFEQPLADTTVRERVIMWHVLPRIDCEVDLADFNGRLWREFRLAMPLALEDPALAYEVPMGVMQIGRDEIPTTGGHAYGGLVYWQPCKDIHPRMVQNFIDASDAHGGLTLGTSVSVFDWIDPTAQPVSYPVLQPVLLASRKSCNGNGVWYPQAGDHSYRFRLTAHEGDWRRGRKDGIGGNHPLYTVVGGPHASGTLPAEKSFVSLSADNVIVSTIKKCEDDDGVVMRMYDIEGRDRDVKVKLFSPFRAAVHTNLIEEEGRPLASDGDSVSVSVGHHAIETIKLKR
jgi:alpha-mannosidase